MSNEKQLSRTSHISISIALLLAIIGIISLSFLITQQSSAAEGSTWDYSVSYVAEDDPYDVFKTNDFDLKYEVDFHTSENIPAYDPETGMGAIIRIPATLLTERDGLKIRPSQVAIPFSDPRIDGWTPKKTKNSSFNYYIDEDTDELVFFNYEDIEAGSNDAWQVLYKNIKVMNIIDMSTWSLTPTATVTVPQEKDEENEAENGEIEKRTETSSVTPLTGLVDTEAILTSLTKKTYSSTGKAYGPGLYTEKQVSRYITGSLPSDFSGNNFSKYKYVLYRVTATGRGTQPFNLGFIEKPSIEGVPAGRIVGSLATKPTGGTAQDLNGYQVYCEKSARSNWTESFFVVVAYPADQVKVGTIVENTIDMKLVPYDRIDASQVKTAYDKWSYADYDWVYRGRIFGLEKGSDGTYPGWLKVFDAASKRLAEHPEDEKVYADFPFTVRSQISAFDVTHVTVVGQGGNVLGQIKDPAASYRTSTVDDAVYGIPAGDTSDSKGVMLDGKDYYFSSVSITQKDYGYDVWEDDYTTPEKMTDISRQGITIYAMLANPGVGDTADDKGWVKIATVPWGDSGNMSYNFPAEVIAKQPYRVRVDHETINYMTQCDISLNVHIKADSPKVKEWIARNPNIQNIQFENLAGGTGEILRNGSSLTPTAWFHDYTVHDSNYSEPGLQSFSQNLYNTLPVRDNAFKNVTWVEEQAKATKTATTENDVVNGRLNVRYTVTAQDGYRLYAGNAAEYLRQLGPADGLVSPGRNEVIFYDLLPYGMEYDPYVEPIAGRMTANNQTNYKSWSKSQVSVSVDPTDIITNWNGTERTLVKFHIHYAGADPTFFSAVSGNSIWAEGWGVSFGGYWEWKDLDYSDQTSNIVAFQPDVSDNARLLGPDSVVFKDNGQGSSGGGEASQIATVFGPDLDGDSNTTERNVMYAECRVSDNIAMAAQSTIRKYVKADSDVFGAFRQTTAVEPSGTYTYDITTTNPSATQMSNLVVYDHIENAVVDRDKYNIELYGDLNFDEKYWQGTLLGIDTTAAELIGVKPVIWLNTNPQAPTSELDKSQTPTEILTAANGWYQFNEFLSKNGNDITKAKSIAVDLSKKTSGDKFVLNSMQSVSLRIHMKAPWSVPEGIVWAYNNPVFYATHGLNNAPETVAGNSVRVALGSPKDIEIEKEFTGDTPQPVHDVFDNEPFRVRIMECPLYNPSYGVACPSENEEAWKADHSGASVPAHEHIPFSDRVYDVYNKDADGNWVRDESRIYATDANGYASVKAGQKIIFKSIPEFGRLTIEEEESPFWDVSYTKGSYTTEASNEVVTTLIENRYKPVLYAQKTLDSVPTNAVGTEARKQYFTFQVFVNGQPAQKTEFWYVKQAYLNGAIPVKDTTKGNSGIGYTDNQGKFNIQEGDIIALRPGRTGDKWEIREIGTQFADWVCKENSVSGNLAVLGSSGTIQNTYRWKDLLLTKAITHQSAEEAKGQTFTFKIEEAQDIENGITTYTPVIGNRWIVMDGNIEMTQERWTELGRSGEFQGNLAADGTFSANVAGLVIKIEHLDAEHTYRISEPENGYGAPYYIPVSGNVIVKMPLHSLSKTATYTNDWRKRSLIAKKLVEYDPHGEYADAIKEQLKTKTFEMTAEIYDTTAGMSGYQPLGDFEYVLTHENGTTTTGRTDSAGHFTLKANESAFFKDAGFIGAEFRVTETHSGGSDDNFNQIYPADNAPATGTLSDDENIANIVNGAPGVFTLEKTYYIAPGDTRAKTFYDNVCAALDKKDSGQELTATENDLLARAEVTFRMKTKNSEGKWVNWPSTDYEVTRMTYSGEKQTFIWKQGEALTLYPGQSIITKAGQLPPTAEYMITETADSRSWIWRVTDNEWLRCEQTTPAGGKSLTGNASMNSTARIVNTLSSFDVVGSLAEKHMLLGSEDVPDGAELTWIVERYDEGKGLWHPASDIPYITFSGKTGHNWTTEEVLYTLDDGRITLTATESGLPWVRFVEDKVYLGNKNEPKNGELRIRELISESDPTFGQLVGYVKDGADDIFYPADSDKTGVSLTPTDAIAFVNTNRTTSLEVEKVVTEPTDKTFTMVLEQVIETTDGKEPADDLSNVAVKKPGVNLAYTIFDSETGERISNGITNDAGEVVLHGGEYAHFALPDKTFWVVHEKDTVGWKLQSLTPNNEGEPVDPAVEADKLHKLNDTTMLTKQKATTLNVKLEAKEKTPIVHNPGETLSRSDFEVIVINSDGEEKTLSLADPWRIVPTTIPKDPASSGITSSTYYVDIWYNGLWTSVPVKVNYPGLMQTWAFVS